MSEIALDIVKAIGKLFIECFLIWTGEIVLFIITLGKHKPKWDLYAEAKPQKFVIFTEISLWLGVAFWIGLIIIIKRAL